LVPLLEQDRTDPLKVKIQRLLELGCSKLLQYTRTPPYISRAHN
jgi:hypothetical protein